MRHEFEQASGNGVGQGRLAGCSPWGLKESDMTEQLNNSNSYYKVVLCFVTHSCPTLCNPMDCSPPGSSVHGDFAGKNTKVGRRAFLQGIFPIQELNPDLLQLQADSLLTEPPGKPKNTGVGSLSFSRGSS